LYVLLCIIYDYIEVGKGGRELEKKIEPKKKEVEGRWEVN